MEAVDLVPDVDGDGVVPQLVVLVLDVERVLLVTRRVPAALHTS